MHLTDALNNVAGQFTDDYQGTLEGTVVDAAWLNAVQNEIVAVLTLAGITPEKASQTQLAAAIMLLLNTKAPLNSPALTGVPTAPTAAPGTNTAQLATTAFTTLAINALINSAPGALDTLNELAAALGADPNFAATMTAALAAKETPAGAQAKVDAVHNLFTGVGGYNGYLAFPCKSFPGGIAILQWALGAFTTTPDSQQSVAWPIPFPHDVFACFPTTIGYNYMYGDAWFQEVSGTLTVNGVSLFAEYPGGSMASGVRPRVFAIGY